MQLLKSIFAFIKGIFKFINEYFKSMIFVLIVLFIIASSGEKSSANLIEISLEGAIMDERACRSGASVRFVGLLIS